MSKTILQRVQAIADASLSSDTMIMLTQARLCLLHATNPDALERSHHMVRTLRGWPQPQQDAILTLIEALVVGPKVAT